MWTKLLELMGRASTGRNVIAITPNDSADIAPSVRPAYLMVSGAGNLTYEGDNGTPVTHAVAAETVLPFSPRRIYATGTTATGIRGYW